MSKLIPFRWMPGSWGLKGQAFDIAEAHYLYEGEELDRRLATITIEDSLALRTKMLDIDQKYGKIGAYEHDVAVANLMDIDAHSRERLLLTIELEHKRIDEYKYDVESAKLTITNADELEINLLEIEAKHGKITDIAAQKEIATLRGEPWIGVIEDSFDPEKGTDGFTMKLDWNDFWITELREAGYDGYDEDDIVRAWFQDVCQETSTLDDMKVIPFPNNREGS